MPNLPMRVVGRLRGALRPPAGAGRPLERLFFLHVPKCGGTSVGVALRRPYEEHRHATVQLDIGASVRGAKAMGLGLRAYHNVLLSYALADERNRYVAGHFMFDHAAWAAFGGGWKAVTLLRDPEERLLSHYFYNRYKEGEQFRIREPLPDFLGTWRARRMGAVYVDYFANPEDRREAGEPEAIGRAAEVLGRFAVVGLLERLDLFARDVEGVFGFRPEVGHRRRSPRDEEQRAEEVTDEVRARVRELCAPSRQVYEAVRSALDQRGSWRGVSPADLAPGGHAPPA